MKKIVIAVSLLIVLAGCATKNYGRSGNLTAFEQQTLTCREIELEEAKTQGFLDHINSESQFDGRSVLSFLGDFGIGNVMEKNSAVKSANDRLHQLSGLKAARNCQTSTPSPV